MGPDVRQGVRVRCSSRVQSTLGRLRDCPPSHDYPSGSYPVARIPRHHGRGFESALGWLTVGASPMRFWPTPRSFRLSSAGCCGARLRSAGCGAVAVRVRGRRLCSTLGRARCLPSWPSSSRAGWRARHGGITHHGSHLRGPFGTCQVGCCRLLGPGSLLIVGLLIQAWRGSCGAVGQAYEPVGASGVGGVENALAVVADSRRGWRRGRRQDVAGRQPSDTAPGCTGATQLAN